MVMNKRIVFQVDESQEANLKNESKRTGAPVAEILRRRLSNPLVGKYFHSVKDDRETIVWQGQITGEVSPGIYLVQLFEWVMGMESNQQIVPAADMIHWKIYDSQDEMNAAYKNYEMKKHHTS